MEIGLIGIGELGKAIAGNLLKAGLNLHIHDLNRAAAEPVLAQGAHWSASAVELAGRCQVILTALPTPAVVEQVLLADGGVLAGMQPGTAWIDHSTNDGQVLQRIARRAARRSVDVIEAPVTGGIPLAHAGEITVLVGAEQAAFNRYRPLLEAVGNPVLHLGPVGSASIVKVITNMLALGHLWLLGEALMLGKQAGLATGALFEAIKASCGNSFVAETEGPPILNGSYDYGFTLELANKDLRLVQQIAEQTGVPLEMGGLVQSLFLRAEQRFGPNFWSTGVVRLLEESVGSDLRAPGYEPSERW